MNRNRELLEHMEHTDHQGTYGAGLADGLAAATALTRAGCTGDDLAGLLDIDPARADPRGYSDHLGELRTILGTGFGVFGGDE